MVRVEPDAGRVAAWVLGYDVPGRSDVVRAADTVWHADFDADHGPDLEDPRVAVAVRQECSGLRERYWLGSAEESTPIAERCSRTGCRRRRRRLFGCVCSGGGKEQAGGLAIKQKVLLPRPPPEKIPAKRRGRPPGTGRTNAEKVPAKRRGRPPGTGRTNAEKVKGLEKNQKPAKLAAGRKNLEKKRLDSKPTTEPTRSSKGAPDAGLDAQVEDHGAIVIPALAKILEPHVSGTPVRNGATNQGTTRDSAKPSEPVTPSPSPPVADPELHWENPSVYINVSNGEKKLVLKPQNQTLRVEITVTERFDTRAFRILGPEPNESDSPSHREAVLDESNLQVGPTDSRPQDTCPPRRENKSQTASAEAFSRNLVDPAYAFSDDDEPTLPRERPQRKPSRPKPTKTPDFGHGALREISQNVGSRAATPAGKPVGDEATRVVGSTAAVRAQSPTHSLSLDNAMDHGKGGSLNSPERGPIPRQPVLVTGPEKVGNEKSSPSEGTYKRRMSRRKSMLEANPHLVVEPDPRKPPTSSELNSSFETPRAAPSPTNRQRRLGKVQLQETPARATHRAVIRGRSSLKPPMRQEIPETSPSAQPAVSPPTTDGPAQILEVLDSDPPFSSEEQIHALSDQLIRAPSPTLTDPSSKPQPSPSLPKQPQPPPTPHTPVKAPNRRRSKSTTTATATTKPTTATKKKKTTGILSLLPTTTAATASDEEDELSILSPAKPSTTTRATPAGHHVRLGLLAPGLTNSASASRLKSAVLAGSPTAAARGRRRKSAAAAAGPWTPSSSAARLLEAELVQTPGGTMRRCGEGGFRCEREFCFSCL
ncbi:hypothetical protein B0I37DRAFT_447203 [Chaetomium sp. MPI-CAGE-AT-0009]|nr:hypothetical protein B0I37DRAFT_447203 [Chaetomium sp. MPI-CAGE-AT-0009]